MHAAALACAVLQRPSTPLKAPVSHPVPAGNQQGLSHRHSWSSLQLLLAHGACHSPLLSPSLLPSLTLGVCHLVSHLRMLPSVSTASIYQDVCAASRSVQRHHSWRWQTDLPSLKSSLHRNHSGLPAEGALCAVLHHLNSKRILFVPCLPTPFSQNLSGKKSCGLKSSQILRSVLLKFKGT